MEVEKRLSHFDLRMYNKIILVRYKLQKFSIILVHD